MSRMHELFHLIIMHIRWRGDDAHGYWVKGCIRGIGGDCNFVEGGYKMSSVGVYRMGCNYA